MKGYKRTFDKALGYAANLASQYAYHTARRKLFHLSTPTRKMVQRYAGRRSLPVEYGMVGRRYKKPRRKGASKYALYGVIRKLETSSVISDDECVYVGGATLPAGAMVGAVCGAIVRAIFRKTQYAMVDEQRTIQADGGDPVLTMKIVYRDDTNGALKSVNSSSTTDGWFTYSAMSNQLRTMMYNAASSTNSYFEIVQIRVYQTTSAGIPVNNYLNASDTYLEMVGTMNVQIQNRTPASSGAENSESAESILANPLRGKIYDCSTTLATFKFNNDSSTTATIQPNQITGLFNLGANNVNLEPEMQQVIKKPPPAYAFDNVKASAFFRQNPGKIRRLSRVTHRKLSLKSFGLRMANALQLGNVSNSYNPLGEMSFVGMEKLCDLGVGLTPTPVTVGFEYNHTISCVAWSSKQTPVNPLVTLA